MKKLSLAALLALCAFMLLHADSAFAEKGKTYATFKLSKYHPINQEYDRPMGYEVALGRFFTENFAMELGYGQYITRSEDEGNRPYWYSLQEPILGRWEEQGKLEITPVTLTFRAVSSNDYSQAYLGAGLGAYFVHYEAELDSEEQETVRFSEDDTIYGLHLETGLGYYTLENIYLGISGRYIFTEMTHFRRDVYGLNVEGEDRLNGYFVMGEVTLRF